MTRALVFQRNARWKTRARRTSAENNQSQGASAVTLEPAELTFTDVEAAAQRITGRVRPLTVARLGEVAGIAGDVFAGLEFLQYTGTFKARGAQNFLEAHRALGTLPKAGVAIASGGNAGLACAWAAGQQGIPATVFLPENAPRVKADRLHGYGADVRLIGHEYAEALAACHEFAAQSGALVSHAYDNPLIAAGAGTLMLELVAAQPELDTVVVSVGGGGLFAGIATVARRFGIRTVAVEPENCRALNEALTRGEVTEVPVNSVAADSLGARSVSETALRAAQHPLVESVLVPDDAIVNARRYLWPEHRLLVEHAAATAFAGLTHASGYRPGRGEKVAVVLCGANTDPSDVAV
jgi:threonine dehydratase